MKMKKEQKEDKFRYDVSATFTTYKIPFHLNHSFESEEDMTDFLNKTKKFDHIYDIKLPKDVLEHMGPFVTAPKSSYRHTASALLSRRTGRGRRRGRGRTHKKKHRR